MLNTRSELSLASLLMVCLTGALLLLFGSLVFGFSALYFRDILQNYHPLLELIKTTFWQGEIPFWNPYFFNGNPQLVGLEPPVFYPLSWMFFLLPFQQALGFNLILHHLLAALGIYGLGHTYGWSWTARSLAAISFTLSGVMVSMNNFHPLQNTVALIPLLLWATHFMLEHPPRRSSALILSLLYGLQILSGHLEIVYFTSLLLLAYACLFLKSRGLKPMLWLIAALGFGVLLSAVQLLPSLMYMPLSIRQAGLELGERALWSYHPLLSIMFILPETSDVLIKGQGLFRAFGEERFGNSLFFFSTYLGLLSWGGVLMALSSLPKNPERKYLIFWLSVLCVALLLAFGHYFPLYNLISYLPGMSFFRYPSKFLILVSLAFSLLAGWGFHELSTHTFGFRRLGQILIGLLCLLALGFACTWFMRAPLALMLANRAGEQIVWGQELVNVLLLQQGRQLLCVVLLLSITIFSGRLKNRPYLLACLLLGFAGLDLLANGSRTVWLTSPEIMRVSSPVEQFLSQRQLQHRPQERYLVANHYEGIPETFRSDLNSMVYFRPSLYKALTLSENFGMVHGFRQAYGFWPAQSQLSSLFYQIYAQSPDTQALRISLESLSAVRYLLLNNPGKASLAPYLNKQDYQQLKYFSELNTYIFENRNWLPRARFVYQSAALKDIDQIPQTFASPETYGFKLKEQVLLLDDQALQQARALVPAQEAKMKRWTLPQITSETNHALELAFKTNTSGYLVLADQYIPGWTAYDNGREVPILRANFFHRALRVGPGQHQIRFVYQPPGFKAGSLITFAAAAVWLICCLFVVRKGRQKPLQPVNHLEGTIHEF